MPVYEVEDDKGNKFDLEWGRDTPPTPEEMDSIFAQQRGGGGTAAAPGPAPIQSSTFPVDDTDEPVSLYDTLMETPGGAYDAFVGGGKKLLKTVSNLRDLAQPLVNVNARMATGQNLPGSELRLDESLTTPNARQMGGYLVTGALEAAAPASKVSGVAKGLPLAGRMAVEGVGGAAIGGAQEGKAGAVAGGLLGAAAPVVGAAVSAVPKVLTRSGLGIRRAAGPTKLAIERNAKLSGMAPGEAEVAETLRTPGMNRGNVAENFEKAIMESTDLSDAALKAEGTKGTTVDLTKTITRLEEIAARKARAGRTDTAENLRKAIEVIRENVGDVRNASVVEADNAKRLLQEAAKDAYQTPDSLRGYGNRAAQAASAVRQALEPAAPGTVPFNRRAAALQSAAKLREKAAGLAEKPIIERGGDGITSIAARLGARVFNPDTRIKLGRGIHQFLGGETFRGELPAAAQEALRRSAMGKWNKTREADILDQRFREEPKVDLTSPGSGIEYNPNEAEGLIPPQHDPIPLMQEFDQTWENPRYIGGEEVPRRPVTNPWEQYTEAPPAPAPDDHTWANPRRDPDPFQPDTAARQAELDARMEEGLLPSERFKAAKARVDAVRNATGEGVPEHMNPNPSYPGNARGVVDQVVSGDTTPRSPSRVIRPDETTPGGPVEGVTVVGADPLKKYTPRLSNPFDQGAAEDAARDAAAKLAAQQRAEEAARKAANQPPPPDLPEVWTGKGPREPWDQQGRAIVLPDDGEGVVLPPDAPGPDLGPSSTGSAGPVNPFPPPEDLLPGGQPAAPPKPGKPGSGGAAQDLPGGVLPPPPTYLKPRSFRPNDMILGPNGEEFIVRGERAYGPTAPEGVLIETLDSSQYKRASDSYVPSWADEGAGFDPTEIEAGAARDAEMQAAKEAAKEAKEAARGKGRWEPESTRYDVNSGEWQRTPRRWVGPPRTAEDAARESQAFMDDMAAWKARDPEGFAAWEAQMQQKKPHDPYEGVTGWWEREGGRPAGTPAPEPPAPTPAAPEPSKPPVYENVGGGDQQGLIPGTLDTASQGGFKRPVSEAREAEGPLFRQGEAPPPPEVQMDLPEGGNEVVPMPGERTPRKPPNPTKAAASAEGVESARKAAEAKARAEQLRRQLEGGTPGATDKPRTGQTIWVKGKEYAVDDLPDVLPGVRHMEGGKLVYTASIGNEEAMAKALAKVKAKALSNRTRKK